MDKMTTCSGPKENGLPIPSSTSSHQTTMPNSSSKSHLIDMAMGISPPPCPAPETVGVLPSLGPLTLGASSSPCLDTVTGLEKDRAPPSLGTVTGLAKEQLQRSAPVVVVQDQPSVPACSLPRQINSTPPIQIDSVFAPT